MEERISPKDSPEIGTDNFHEPSNFEGASHSHLEDTKFTCTNCQKEFGLDALSSNGKLR